MSSEYIIEHDGFYECLAGHNWDDVSLFIYDRRHNITRPYPCSFIDTDVFFFAIPDVVSYGAESFFSSLRVIV